MRLSDYIKTNNLTATKLSDDAGVSITCITRFLWKEQGRADGRGLTPATAAAISAATKGDVTVEELLFPDGLPDCAKLCANN